MEEICRIKDIYAKLYCFERSFSEKLQITINEAMVLCYLKDKKLKSANELSEHLSLSISRMSRVIKGMESKELIKRECGADDKRIMLFTLTNLGYAKVASIQESGMQSFEQFRKELCELIQNPFIQS